MKMMPVQIWVLLITTFLSACQDRRENSDQFRHPETKHEIDTVVGTRVITDEIAGGAYRKRAKGYFLVTNNNDTSAFTCIVTESNDGAVGIDLQIPYRKTLTHRARMNELTKLLPAAARDFKFDSLKSISLGRLILSGDLAVGITEKFIEEYGGQLPDYQTASVLLKESRLQDDFNRLLIPYKLQVEGVSIEKLFYATKKELLKLNVLEQDTATIPSKIVDCITWVRLKKRDNI